jgi:hypothetical protein
MALPKSFDEGLTLADKLAEFANLRPEGVEDFRTKNPDFMPSRIWDWRQSDTTSPEPDLIWQKMQKTVRAAWETGFSPDDCIELIVKGAEQADRQAIFDDLDSGELELGKAGIVDYVRKQGVRKREVFGYQQAVMFLHVQPWRAAKCPGAMGQPCGKYFVKAAKRSIYCSENCFNANRSADKRKWWTNVGTKQRAQKSKVKTKGHKK